MIADQEQTLKEGDEVVCSLRRRDITLASPLGDLETVGISHVATPEAYRGRGHASTLVRRVMSEATDARAFLLLSDIDPSFYEKLGFTTLSHVTWTARTEALPMRPARLEPTRDLERIVEIYEESWRPGWVRTRRTSEAWHDTAGDIFLVGEADYIVARRLDSALWIDDAATTEISRDDLWASCRMLATAVGAEHVAGWLRPEHGGGPFVATGRKTCIPMLASDEPLGDVRAHFSSLDRI